LHVMWHTVRVWDNGLVFLQVVGLFLIFASRSIEKILSLPTFEISKVLSWLCFIVVLLGGTLLLFGAAKLGKMARIHPKPASNSTLKSDGVFSWSRHPMYSGIILGTLCWSLMVGSYFALAATLFLVIVLYFKSRREEFYLTEKYGVAYKKYQKKVGRFSPFF